MGEAGFVLYLPLILTGFMEVAAPALAFLERNPSIPLVSSLKDTFKQGVQHKGHFLEMRSDIEVYLGFYLIIGWFLGWSGFLSIILYWQLMRMRYMMSYNIQGAFKRLDTKLQGYTSLPACPGIVKSAYMKVRGFMSNMADAEA